MSCCLLSICSYCSFLASAHSCQCCDWQSLKYDSCLWHSIPEWAVKGKVVWDSLQVALHLPTDELKIFNLCLRELIPVSYCPPPTPPIYPLRQFFFFFWSVIIIMQLMCMHALPHQNSIILEKINVASSFVHAIPFHYLVPCQNEMGSPVFYLVLTHPLLKNHHGLFILRIFICRSLLRNK